MKIESEGYVAIYGTIDFVMIQLIQILNERTFGMVPEETYQGWLKSNDFQIENSEKVECADGIVRTRATASFRSNGHEWRIQTYQCPHPYDSKSKGWRFISLIERDEVVVAHSVIAVDEFESILRQKSQPST